MKSILCLYRIERTPALVTLRYCHRQRWRAILPERSRRYADISQAGFDYGFCGVGSAQLALAILLDFCNNADQALTWYEAYQREQVATWESHMVTVKGIDLAAWIKRKLENPATATPATAIGGAH